MDIGSSNLVFEGKKLESARKKEVG